jgi:uncharacterized protein (TIRG00374 family)
MKKVVQLTLGCAISIGMLVFALWDLKFDEVLHTLADIKLWPIIPFLFFFGIHVGLRAYRWQFFLPETDGPRPTVRTLFDSFMLGNLATLLLPGRLGEVVRPLVLTRWSHYSFGTSFISVVIERFFDLSAVLLSFALIAPFLESLPDKVVLGAYFLGGMATCLLLFIMASCAFPSFIRSMVAFFLKPMPKVVSRVLGKFLNDLIDGSAVIKTPARLAVIVGLTGLVWLTAYLQFYAILYMFPGDLSFLLSVTIGVFVALAIAAPSAPGFFGVWQFGCVQACALFAYPVPVAQAYSLISHFMSYIPAVAIGFYLLTVHGMSIGDLKSAGDRDEAKEPCCAA